MHELADQGLSQRAIARQTGHHRRTIAQWLALPVPDIPEGMPDSLSELAALPLPQQRQARRQQLREQVQALRSQRLGYVEIARRVGLHRVTVARWLQHPLNLAEQEYASATAPEVAAPPTPWSSWDEVQQVREALGQHRFLFMQRPEQLSEEEAQVVERLLSSPVGATLQVARSFLIDWYRLWSDATGTRHTLDEARTLYAAWCTNPDYQDIPTLQQALERMTPAKFERVSQFLRNPEWEATNNGAERGGRAFRHQQAPHFNFRSAPAIERAIEIAAINAKNQMTQAMHREANHCSRGRKQRVTSAVCAVA